MNRNIAAYGIYPHQPAVNEAVDALRASGFRNTDISVLFPENTGSKDFAHEKHTKAPEGAAVGGGSGAALGAAVGWLAGAGAMMVPGLEPVAAAGPVMGMLSGIGVGGVLGGVAGGLVGMGKPEYEAKRFEGRKRNGGILLSVHCDNPDWANTAVNVLKRTGALNVSTASEARADFAHAEKPSPRTHAPIR
jgi:hypothetical protein